MANRKPKQTRRPYGEGSIYQDKRNRWYFSIRLGSGKRQITRCASEAEAKTLQADSLRHLRSGGQLASAKGHTLTTYLQEWLDVSHDILAPATRALYEGFIHSHLEQDIGRLRLAEVTTPSIQLFMRRIGKTLKPASVIRLRGMMRSALSAAVDWGLIYENPVAKTRPPKDNQKTEIRPLTKDQANALLNTVSGHRLELLYRMALCLGLRQGELLGLRWVDIDDKHFRIYVRTSLKHEKEYGLPTRWYLGSLKTTKSKRVLDLTPELHSDLVDHWVRQEGEKTDVGTEWVENGLVFTSERGTPLLPQNLRRHFEYLLDKAGIQTLPLWRQKGEVKVKPEGDKIRFHDLRHTFATLSLMNGVPLKTVSDMLGHSSISVTADVYGHVYPENKRDALILIDGLLREGLTSQEDVV